MQPCLPEELTEIYSTPTPKGWLETKSKGLDLFYRCELSITIVGVQYLYPRLDCESWSNKTGCENLEKRTKLANLR
jgi:hypothetical protein